MRSPRSPEARLASGAGVRWVRGLVALATVLWISGMAWNTWIFEDAFISFRVVDQAVAGNGLRWNVDERVMVYSHPLWVLAMCALASLGFGAMRAALVLTVLSVAALWPVAWRVLALDRSVAATVALLVAAMLCGTLTEYTSSGLENPATLLVVVALVGLVLTESPSLRAGAWLASALVLLRPESVAFSFPAVLWLTREHVRLSGLRSAMTELLAGLSGLTLWTVGATVYYGTPIPNPVLAKAGLALDRVASAANGLTWLGGCLREDPVAAIALVGAAYTLFRPGPLGRAGQMLSAGVALECLALVGAGGDYVFGRLLVLPVGASVALLARRLVVQGGAGASVWIGASLVAALVHTQTAAPVERGGELHHARDDDPVIGFSDAWNYTLGVTQDVLWTTDDRVVVSGFVGQRGHASELDRHILDPYALADALLSRMPSNRGLGLPGHVVREVPPWYVDAVRARSLADVPDLAVRDYAEDVWSLTRDPLFSLRRARAAVRLGLVEPAFETPTVRWRVPAGRRVDGLVPTFCADAPAGGWGDGSQTHLAVLDWSVLLSRATCGVVVRDVDAAGGVWLSGGRWAWVALANGLVVGSGEFEVSGGRWELERTSLALDAGAVTLWIAPTEGEGVVGRVDRHP